MCCPSSLPEAAVAAAAVQPSLARQVAQLGFISSARRRAGRSVAVCFPAAILIISCFALSRLEPPPRFTPDVLAHRWPMPFIMQLSLLVAALGLSLGKPAASWDAGPLARSSRINSEVLDELATKAQAALATPPTATEVVPGASCACTSRVYAASCPIDWAEGAGGHCQPPAGYNGLCSKALSFTGEPTRVKMEAEGLCSVCWPCP